ncbi:MAG: galactokinase [Beutenbergiaceae bacterium]
MSENTITAWPTSDGVAAATATFTSAFDAPPDGVWYAPGRVNLIGEHTDYNAGLALPIALPHRTFAAIRHRSDDRVRLVSAAQSQPWQGHLSEVAPGRVSGWAGYAVGVAWALGQSGRPSRGFDAAIASCVPFGAGLSSSAALEAAVGLGLAEPGIDRATLAQVCRLAENEIAGANTGGMDQVASLQCRADHALLLDCRDGNVRHLPFDLAGSGLELLVIDTRAPHALVDGHYAQRRATCERAAAELGIAALREIEPAGLDQALARLPAGERPLVRHVVTEIERVRQFSTLLESGRLGDVGPLMHASHASLRDDYRVSCPELDLAVDTAERHGAVGARMTGGGFGGSAIALVPGGSMEQITNALARAFDHAGFLAPAFLRVVKAAASGARAS